jgi:hypothetical protein
MMEGRNDGRMEDERRGGGKDGRMEGWDGRMEGWKNGRMEWQKGAVKEKIFTK